MTDNPAEGQVGVLPAELEAPTTESEPADDDPRPAPDVPMQWPDEWEKEWERFLQNRSIDLHQYLPTTHTVYDNAWINSTLQLLLDTVDSDLIDIGENGRYRPVASSIVTDGNWFEYPSVFPWDELVRIHRDEAPRYEPGGDYEDKDMPMTSKAARLVLEALLMSRSDYTEKCEVTGQPIQQPMVMLRNKLLLKKITPQAVSFYHVSREVQDQRRAARNERQQQLVAGFARSEVAKPAETTSLPAPPPPPPAPSAPKPAPAAASPASQPAPTANTETAKLMGEKVDLKRRIAQLERELAEAQATIAQEHEQAVQAYQVIFRTVKQFSPNTSTDDIKAAIQAAREEMQ